VTAHNANLFTRQGSSYIRAQPFIKDTEIMKKKRKQKPQEEPEKHVRARRVLNRVGTDLYGPRWQSELGRALKVNLRTTRRWFSGKSRIDKEYWVGMQKLLDRQEERLGETKSIVRNLVEHMAE
jgi:hypothetical protein